MGATLRALFKFRYSSLVLAAFPPLAVGAVMAKYYWPAYFVFLFSGVWALIQWYLSDSRSKSSVYVTKLRLKAKKDGALDKRIAEFKRAYRKYVLKDIGVCSLVVLPTLLTLFWTYVEQRQYFAEQERIELSLAYGKLYPRHEPIPENACSHHSDKDFRVFLSFAPSSEPIVGIIDQFPRTVINKRNRDTVVVKIDKNDDGSLAISLEIKNVEGKVLVRITNGEFEVSEHHTFWNKRPRPDKSHLKVDDDTGKTVLDLDFFNPLAMKIGLNIKEAELIGFNKDACFGFTKSPLRPAPMFDINL